ncbi:hypothetical protein OUZ56_002688 [Daphnia magna]|uniref:Uncharacterized protein n=1 Tax=Daphnia magna TaxID=35525 RepID=A0ABR0A6H9_9CRUS|nr:hypothetical protein OUZ56_002688 [Daphnia magna]
MESYDCAPLFTCAILHMCLGGMHTTIDQYSTPMGSWSVRSVFSDFAFFPPTPPKHVMLISDVDRHTAKSVLRETYGRQATIKQLTPPTP